MSIHLDRPNTFSVISELGCLDPAAEPAQDAAFRRPESKLPTGPRDQRIYERNRIVCHSEHTPEVDLFRMSATQIVNWLEEKQGHSFAVTSCGGGEGKTLIAVNLAICLAKNSNYETVLVDSDLRRPNVSNVLGIDVEFGLEQVLAGNATLNDCILTSEIDGLFILPTKSALEPSSRLLSTARLTRLAKDIEAMQQDRLVLFDLPPVLLGDSCAPFLKAADGCMIVVEEGRTTKAHLQRALSLIRPDKLIGVTLNKASERVVQENGYISYDYYSADE